MCTPSLSSFTTRLHVYSHLVPCHNSFICPPLSLSSFTTRLYVHLFLPLLPLLQLFSSTTSSSSSSIPSLVFPSTSLSLPFKRFQGMLTEGVTRCTNSSKAISFTQTLAKWMKRKTENNISFFLFLHFLFFIIILFFYPLLFSPFSLSPLSFIASFLFVLFVVIRHCNKFLPGFVIASVSTSLT